MKSFTITRLSLIVIIQLFFLGLGYAQYSNNWIVPQQNYVKIGVNSKGIYEVTFQQLREKGLNISTNNVDAIALFHRGKEVAITTTPTSIIFYGEPNDGASDSLLYRPHSARVNEHYSMFSDIGYYFVTIGKSKGVRSTISNYQGQNDVASHPWHWAEILDVYNSQHSFSFGVNESPSLLQSYYSNGETRTGNIVLGKTITSYEYQTEHLFSDTKNGINPTVEIMVNNRSNGSNRIIIASKDLKLHTFNVSGFNGIKETIQLSGEHLQNESISFKVFSELATSKFSVTYVHLKYPQLIKDLTLLQQKVILPSVNHQWSKFSIKKSDTNVQVVGYDVTDKYNTKILRPNPAEDSLLFYTERKRNTESSIYLTTSYLEPLKLESVNFQDISPRNTDFIIITNNTLKEAAQSYANYRSSKVGGNYKANVFDIQDIYNSFNYGEPSPIAIKNFARFMLSDKNLDKNLLLIGHTITFSNRIIKELKGVPDRNEDFMHIDQIPSVGYPGSDALLVDGLDERQTINLPAIPVGRLAATLPSQVYDYLDKVIEFESDSVKTYQKNILHLSGGKTTSEINVLKNHLGNLENGVFNSFHGGIIESMAKQTLNPVDQVDISTQVNEGIGLITYFGHGSGSTTDYNMGYASYVDRGYRNKGKYPFMYFNGCGVANIFPGRYSTVPKSTFEVALSTDWVLAKDKGAIAVLANSGDSYISTSSTYLNTLYKYLFNNHNGLSVGQIQIAITKELLAQNLSSYDIANLHQSFLQGDPTLKIFYQTKSDYTFSKGSGITLSSTDPSTTIGASKDLKLSLSLANVGANLDEKDITLSVDIFYNNTTRNHTFVIDEIKNESSFEFVIPNNEPIQFIRATIESTKEYQELDENNNERTLMVDWQIAEKSTEYRESHFSDIVAPTLTVLANSSLLYNNQKLALGTPLEVQLIDNFPLTNSEKSLISVYYRDCDSCPYKALTDTIQFDASRQPNTLFGSTTLNLPVGKYELLFQGKDIEGNESSAFTINIEIVDTITSSIEVVASPNPGFGYFKLQTHLDPSIIVERIEYTIIDLLGATISHYTDKAVTSKVSTWTWSHTIPGNYLYRVKVITPAGEIIKSGKLINYP